METVTVPRSVCIDGEWFAAHWAVQAVDGGSGELLITAATPDLAVVLRMDMETAKALRRMAGHGDGADVPCYGFRTTTGERLAVLEDRLQILSDTMRRIVASIDGRLDALEAELETLNEDLENLNLRSRVGYLERQAQGISGVDAGLRGA